MATSVFQRAFMLRLPVISRFTSTSTSEGSPVKNNAPTAQPGADTSTAFIHKAYKSNEDVDIEALYASTDIRRMLHSLSRFELRRIFSKQRREWSAPKFKFLTDDQLRIELNKAKKKARYLTMPPPVMRERQPCDKVLRTDPEIADLYKSRFIFTDISYGYSDRSRMVVVRETDGVLRTANWEERERMIQSYFPRETKEIDCPAIFSEPQLTKVLDKGWYSFLLDRACVQFDPDDPRYLNVTHKVYQHLQVTKKFNSLRSTRHFGAMCFYYAVTNTGDALMLELILTNRIKDAGLFVKLLHRVCPENKSIDFLEGDTDDDLVQAYIKADSKTSAALDLAYQTHLESRAESKQSGMRA